VAITTVCDRVCVLLSVMVSHGERCDGNCLGSSNGEHIKSKDASERMNARDVRTEQMHADSELLEGEIAIEE